MTYDERVAKARDNIDFLWKQTVCWMLKKDTDPEILRIWSDRWNAACDMYEILTGDRYDG